jgi:hypothetical protein
VNPTEILTNRFPNNPFSLNFQLYKNPTSQKTIYKITAKLPTSNAESSPNPVITEAKIIASFEEIIPEGRGLSGELILSTSMSKISFKIIADPDRKNPYIKPRNIIEKDGKLPSAIISPRITQTPAENGNSGLTRFKNPFILLKLNIAFLLVSKLFF